MVVSFVLCVKNTEKFKNRSRKQITDRTMCYYIVKHSRWFGNEPIFKGRRRVEHEKNITFPSCVQLWFFYFLELKISLCFVTAFFFNWNWISSSIFDFEVCNQSFHSLQNDCFFGKKGLESCLQYQIFMSCNVSCVGFPLCSGSFEGLMLKFPINKTAVVYKPTSSISERQISSNIEKFLTDNELICKNLLNLDKFNFPYIDWVNWKIIKSSMCALKLLKFYFSNSLKQLVCDFTRENNILWFL